MLLQAIQCRALLERPRTTTLNKGTELTKLSAAAIAYGLPGDDGECVMCGPYIAGRRNVLGHGVGTAHL